jgi:hypothetical protein
MQLRWRVLGKGELDHEGLWLSVSAGGLLCAAAWFALGLPWPVCWFHQLTGHPCATCGATRAAIAFFHGLAFLAYCGIAVFNGYALGVLIMRSRRLRASFTTTEKHVLRAAAVAVIALNWVYLLTHSSMFDSV